MTSANRAQQTPRPALLCFDGSDSARQAIEHAGAVLGGGPAVVLCVWESVGSTLPRHSFTGGWQMGREIGEISSDVVDQLDAGTAEWADATAAEGAEIADGAGFDARKLPRRALGRVAERREGTVWEEILDVAEEEDARVIALGSRGRSAVKAALLGSVSYGVVHNAALPVLIVPSSR